ncbi:MAG TPA: tetratricopeptide repeat protein, partial [Candidatus Obscuribacter sp.]|nr:tetratricopeptide repeat protein [Candidatus Obscuribacter sp.]
MAHPKKVFVSALLSIFTSGLVALAPVQAKLTLINTLLSSSQSEYDKGNYLVSLKLSERALEVAQESKAGALAEASALLNVTLNLSALGQYDAAEQDFKKLLAMLDQYKLMRYPVAILAFNNYAAHTRNLGRYTEAEAFLNKAVDLGTRNFGVNSVQNVLSVNNLASLYLSWGKLKEAEALVDRTIELAKAPKAKNTIAGPYSLFNQSKLAELKGDYKEAQVLLQKALEQATTIYGAKHAYVSLIYKGGLAPVSIKNYDFEKAENYARLSLEIDEKT